MSAQSAPPIIVTTQTTVGATSVLFYIFVGHITGTAPISYYAMWGDSPTSQINRVDALPFGPAATATQYFVRIDNLNVNTTYYFKMVASNSVSPVKESDVVSLTTQTFSGFEIIPDWFFQTGSAINVRNNRISPKTIIWYCFQGRIRAETDPNKSFFAECRNFELGELSTGRHGLGADQGLLNNRYYNIIDNITQIRKYIDTNAPGQGRANIKGGKEVCFIQDISADQVSRETICYTLKLGPETVTPLYQRKSIKYIDNKTDFIISEGQDRLLCIKPQG